MYFKDNKGARNALKEVKRALQTPAVRYATANRRSDIGELLASTGLQAINTFLVAFEILNHCITIQVLTRWSAQV